MTSFPTRPNWRAHAVYARLLWAEFRLSVLAFLAVLTVGSLSLYGFYDLERLSFPKAMWGTFTLIFFQPSLEFPGHPWLEILFFVIPFLSALIVIEGLVRFSVLMINRKNNREVWHMALATTCENHVILAGMGKIGTRVARLLLADGERLLVVEKDRGRLPFDELEKAGAAVLAGDVLDADVFARLQVERAKCLIACTDNDLVNFEIALKARSINPDLRVVLRLFNDHLAAQVQDHFNISIVYSSSALAAPSFASAVYSKHIKDSFIIDNERFCLLHCPVDAASPVANRTHQEIEREFEATIIVHKDAERRKKPNENSIRVEAGDNLILIMPFRIIKPMQGKI